MNDTDARLWHPWLRINRVLRVMLQTCWSAEAWPQVKAEFKKALALRSKIQRAGCFSEVRICRMAKQRPEKKREPAQPATRRVLPMELRIGDRLVDETGEWEVVSQPYTTAGGKTARVRVQRVGQTDVTDLRTWGAHERVSVKRATAEEGNR